MRRKALLMGSGLHPYTRKILKRARDEAFTLPSSSTIKAMDKMIRRLVDENLWNRFDAHFWFAYNDVNLRDFSRIDWISPDIRLNSGSGSLDFTVNGWKFDGLYSIDSGFRWSSAAKGSLNDAHTAAIVYDSSEAVDATTGIISGSNTNGVNRWSAFNTNLQRINANTSISPSVNLSGTGYKTISRTSSTDVILTSGISTFSSTGNSYILANNNELIGANSTNRGRVGICNISFGSAINDKYMLLRTIYNEFLTSIGLTGFA